MHIPVLLHEVIEYAKAHSGSTIIDATLGGGGHARHLLPLLEPGGQYYAFEWDAQVYANTKMSLADLCSKTQCTLINDSYTQIANYIQTGTVSPADCLIADLGFSSFHIDDLHKGFSFQKDEPLDMRYNESVGPSAAELVSCLLEEQLADILFRFGEERFARHIAKALVVARKKELITTTGQLVKIISYAVPAFYRHQKISCATKTFQALRIAVNHELDNLSVLLSSIPALLKPQGRALIISFHSLEDRMVKRGFLELAAQGQGKIITKKPVCASEIESSNNPRSRSAKLRVFEKTA